MFDLTSKQVSDRKSSHISPARCRSLAHLSKTQRPIMAALLFITITLLAADHWSLVLPANALFSRLNPRRLVSFALSSKPSTLVAEPVHNKLPQKQASDPEDHPKLRSPDPLQDRVRDLDRSTSPTTESSIGTTRMPFEQQSQRGANSSRQADNLADADSDGFRNGSAIVDDLLQQLLDRARFGQQVRAAANENLTAHQTDDISPLEPPLNDYDMLVDPTQVPLVQLLTIADSPQTIEVTSETTTKSTDERLQKLQQNFDDRFIHYDTDPLAPEPIGSPLQQQSYLNESNEDTNQLSGVLPVIRASQLDKLGSSHLGGYEEGESGSRLQRQNRTSGRLGERNIHQARSMGSQVPQHSKPPYASYNQFHERANLLRQSATTTPTATLPTKSPIVSVAPSSAHRHKPEPTEQPQTGANYLTSKSHELSKNATQQLPPRYSNSNNIKAEINQSLNILHSIGQISSHLASSSSEPVIDSNLRKPEVSPVFNIDQNSTNLTGNHIDRRDEADVDIKTLRDRLAPASPSVIDLSPMPDSVDPLDNKQLDVDLNHLPSLQMGDDSSSRFYFSPNIFGQSLLAAASADSYTQAKRDSDRVSHNNRYFETTSTTPNPTSNEKDNSKPTLSPPAQQVDTNDLKLTERNRVESTTQASAHEFRGAAPPASELLESSVSYWNPQHKKTAESLKSQVLNSDKSTQQEQPEQSHKNNKLDLPKAVMQSVASVASAMLSSTGNSIQNSSQYGNTSDNLRGHKHMASLTNVTAPIISPASATEAMKSALDISQTSKRVSYRPNVNERDLLNAGNATVSGRRPPQRIGVSSLYQPASFEQPTSYSAPANQLFLMDSFPKNTQNESADDERSFADHITDKLNFSGSLAVSNAASSEMMRAQSNYEPNITRVQQASGFRSPTTAEPHLSSSSFSNSHRNNLAAQLGGNFLSLPSSYLSKGTLESGGGSADKHRTVPPSASAGASSSKPSNSAVRPSGSEILPSVTGGFSTESGLVSSANVTTGSVSLSSPHHATTSTSVSTTSPANMAEFLSSTAGGNGSKRALNLTRVEHISADCSDDLIRAVIVFNGTFKGIIYSSGYVRDPSCLYINGTGKTRYDFSIRLNQCGTLGRQELHTPTGPNDIRRRDQVVWNTLSIQYNPIIEQEWDEHFRVSCEYGSDFWKTVSFSPFNVETNTGSPVVFTVNPPQCQMEILRGHGMVGPRQEAVSGPVTVGDPLTLLIHMKSERAGYDILVKNCIAHNGGQQKMQLIDTNGCVVNERFISPFRGTYNDNDLKHVTLYAYLKAFRFTGSPVLYLECEVHMCQSSCPPQMCYWRRLSKRSIGLNETTSALVDDNQSLISSVRASLGSDLTRHLGTNDTLDRSRNRRSRQLRLTDASRPSTQSKPKQTSKSDATKSDDAASISEKVSLFQALEVRQEREPDFSTETDPYQSGHNSAAWSMTNSTAVDSLPLCYRRVEVYAFLMTTAVILVAAISVTVGCCLRARSIWKHNSIYHSPSSQVSSCATTRSNSLWTIPSANRTSTQSAATIHQQHANPLLRCCMINSPSKVSSISVDCESTTGRILHRDRYTEQHTGTALESSMGRSTNWVDSSHLKDRLISNSICY